MEPVLISFLKGVVGMQFKLPKPEPEQKHPTVAKFGHELDAFLRAHGFTILSRKRGEQPQWVRNGKKYPQNQAVKVAESESKKLKGGLSK